MSEPYAPNHIPVRERVAGVFLMVASGSYAGYSLWLDDMWLPLRSRGRGTPDIHLHGFPLWIMCAAFLCAFLVVLSIVMDHYDKRNNETDYRRFAGIGTITGWSLAFIALAVHWLIR